MSKRISEEEEQHIRDEREQKVTSHMNVEKELKILRADTESNPTVEKLTELVIKLCKHLGI